MQISTSENHKPLKVGEDATILVNTEGVGVESVPNTADTETLTDSPMGGNEGATQETASASPESVSEPITERMFGVDVSDISTEYTSSNHRVAIYFRNRVAELERMMFHVGDSSVEEIAKNFKAGINRLEVRMMKTRKEVSARKEAGE